MKTAHQVSFMSMLQYLQLGESKLKIYEILSEKPMTIKNLEKSSKLSERLLRMHLTDLIKKGFVKRRALEDDRLKYVYYATPPENIFNWLRERHIEFDRKMKKAKREIVRGTKIERV